MKILIFAITAMVLAACVSHGEWPAGRILDTLTCGDNQVYKNGECVNR